jgi:hypothetical protein
MVRALRLLVALAMCVVRLALLVAAICGTDRRGSSG